MPQVPVTVKEEDNVTKAFKKRMRPRGVEERVSV